MKEKAIQTGILKILQAFNSTSSLILIYKQIKYKRCFNDYKLS